MQASTKHLDSAVNRCFCCTYELHSAGRCLETMPFSTRGMRRVNDMAAVHSPPIAAFLCHSPPLQSTQTLSVEQVTNGINPRLSMALRHSKCHSEPVCEPESRSSDDNLTLRFGRGFSKRIAEQMRRLQLVSSLAQTVSAQLGEHRILQTVPGESSETISQTLSDKSPTLSAKLQSVTGEQLAGVSKVAETFPLPNKVMASEYKLALPDEKLLEEELQQTKRAIESRKLKTEN